MATRTSPPQPGVTISRWRISALLLLAALVVIRIVIQLVNIQLVQHTDLSERARRDIAQTRPIPQSRGVIRDAKGNVLALDVERESLYALPQQVDPDEAARLSLTLSPLINLPAQEIQNRLLNRDQVWISIKRWLEPEVSEVIGKMIRDADDNGEDLGIRLQPEPKRVYPQGDYAAHVIGAVNDPGDGFLGVEAYYDDVLKGTTGTITAEWDLLNNPIWINPPQVTPATNGEDLELTIDPFVQHVVETELRKGMELHNAPTGTVIVMDPRTGAIRGMASYPTFDPNNYQASSPDVYMQNPAVSGTYEPGSTFKILTVAAGLQARAFTADTQVNDTGAIAREGAVLRNYDGNGHGTITPNDVLYYSSNVGALLFAEKIGKNAFYDAIRAFGYGQQTGVDLGGEAEGIVNYPGNEGWTSLTMDTNAYGQGIAVTPLQQVRMVAAVANDGKLMRPYVVQKRCKDEQCVVTEPQEMGQPIEPGVAWTVRRMLVNAANHYAPLIWQPVTGSFADTWLVPGYQVGAKTGTSDIAENGSYTGQVIGSVAGLAPADDARYAILVKIDKPADDAYGVVTAIPVYQAIVEQLLRYDRVPPSPALVAEGQELGMRVR